MTCEAVITSVFSFDTFSRHGFEVCVFFLLAQTNATNDGEYVFLTGQQDYREFAKVEQWKGQR